MNDEELVRRCLAGEREAFETLVERYWAGVRAAIGRLLSDPAEAEDVTQEAFLQAYLSLGRLRQHERFSGWVYGIAVNLSRMRLRRRPGWLSWEALVGGSLAIGFNAASAAAVPVEVAVEARELHRLVRAAITALPEADREAVRLHYLEGLSQQELAALLGVSTGAIRVRLHRARARLRAQLQSEFGPVPMPQEAKAMIDVTVHDILVQVVEGDGGAVQPAGGHRVVLLKERGGERLLPIWIGDAEADALALQLSGGSVPRPLTFDLMLKLLGIGGIQIEGVAVSALREEVFYATIRARAGDQVHEIDARPSDALNLAVRAGAPIQVAAEVFDGQGIVETGIQAHLEKWQEERHPWRSLPQLGIEALYPSHRPAAKP